MKSLLNNRLLYLLLMLLCLVSTTSCAKKESKPRMVFKALKYDLGVIDSRHRVQMIDVPFVNKGNQELVIKEIRTDCDCTTVAVEPDKYRKGEKGVLQVKVDLSAFFPGSITKQVAVYTNASENPTIIIFIGEVR